MVTYCTGSARQKREYFKEIEGAIVLDNVEVLFCTSENGKNYFAYGDVPFSSFEVYEYVKYGRALESGAVSPSVIKAFGLSPSKRLKRLAPAEMRIVTFLEKTGGETDKAIVVNLDGTKYSRRNARALKRLLAACAEAYVCVTDARFIKHAGSGVKTLGFGKLATGKRPAFYAAKALAKRIGAKRVSVM